MSNISDAEFERLELQLYEMSPNMKNCGDQDRQTLRQRLRMQLFGMTPVVKLRALEVTEILKNIKELSDSSDTDTDEDDASPLSLIAQKIQKTAQVLANFRTANDRKRKSSQKRKAKKRLSNSPERSSPYHNIKLPQVYTNSSYVSSESMSKEKYYHGHDNSSQSTEQQNAMETTNSYAISSCTAISSGSGVNVESSAQILPYLQDNSKDMPVSLTLHCPVALNKVKNSLEISVDLMDINRMLLENKIRALKEFNDMAHASNNGNMPLSRLVSQVFEEPNDSETLLATNTLESINNNLTNNCDSCMPISLSYSYCDEVTNSTTVTNMSAAAKKKRNRSIKSAVGSPKRRGRKPGVKLQKDKTKKPKSDLARYVEFFANDESNLAIGSTTPTASSTNSQHMVSSTTANLDANEQNVIYIGGDWTTNTIDGTTYQLVSAPNVTNAINFSNLQCQQQEVIQDDFNMTIPFGDIVDYVTTNENNSIASALEGQIILPTYTIGNVYNNSQQQSTLATTQSVIKLADNTVVANITIPSMQVAHPNVPPPPVAHNTNDVLDLSSKSANSSIPVVTTSNVVNSVNIENDCCLPIDLSVKSNYDYNKISTKNSTMANAQQQQHEETDDNFIRCLMERNGFVVKSDDITKNVCSSSVREAQLVTNESFKAALDMPLLEIDDEEMTTFIKDVNKQVEQDNSKMTKPMVEIISVESIGRTTPSEDLLFTDIETVEQKSSEIDLFNGQKSPIVDFTVKENSNIDLSEEEKDCNVHVIMPNLTLLNQSQDFSSEFVSNQADSNFSTYNDENEVSMDVEEITTSSSENILDVAEQKVVQIEKKLDDENEVSMDVEEITTSSSENILAVAEQKVVQIEKKLDLENEARILVTTSSSAEISAHLNDLPVTDLKVVQIEKKLDLENEATNLVTTSSSVKIPAQLNELHVADQTVVQIEKKVDLDNEATNLITTSSVHLADTLQTKPFVKEQSSVESNLKSNDDKQINKLFPNSPGKIENEENKEPLELFPNGPFRKDLSENSRDEYKLFENEDTESDIKMQEVDGKNEVMLDIDVDSQTIDLFDTEDTKEETEVCSPMSVEADCKSFPNSSKVEKEEEEMKIYTDCNLAKETITTIDITDIEDTTSSAVNLKVSKDDAVESTSEESKIFEDVSALQAVPFIVKKDIKMKEIIDNVVESCIVEIAASKNNDCAIRKPECSPNVNLQQETNTEIAESCKNLSKPIVTEAENAVESNAKQKDISKSSLLELESELDNFTPDFDELEDDVLSLAPSSCFDSNDEDEVTNTAAVIPQSTGKVKTAQENNTFAEIDSTNGSQQMAVANPTKDSVNILKKFRIPRLAAKNSTPISTMPNVPLNEPTTTKAKFTAPEKITRVIQNDCSATAAACAKQTIQLVTAPSTDNYKQMNYEIPPLMTKIIQPPLQVNVCTNQNRIETMTPTVATCSSGIEDRGEFAGRGGAARNFGPNLIEIARFFGVTCFYLLNEETHDITKCRHTHEFRDVQIIEFKLLNELNCSELNSAYNFMHNHVALFRKYFDTFCAVYAQLKNTAKLQNMVHDCEKYTHGFQHLNTIFHSLVHCGFTKIGACNEILGRNTDISHFTIQALVNIIMATDWTAFIENLKLFSKLSSSCMIEILSQMARTVLHKRDSELLKAFLDFLTDLSGNDLNLIKDCPDIMQVVQMITNNNVMLASVQLQAPPT